MRLLFAGATMIALVLIAFAAHGTVVTVQLPAGRATLTIASPSPTPPAVDYCPSPAPTLPVAGCGFGEAP